MVTLDSYEKGITAIEIAHKNGLLLVRDGQEIRARPAGADKEKAKLALEMIKPHKSDVVNIICNRDSTRQTLSKAHAELSEANLVLGYQLDLLSRLERIYRKLNPDDTKCLHGDSGCESDSVMLCSACANARHDQAMLEMVQDQL